MISKEKQGLLPVRVLAGNIMEWFFNASPGFQEEFENEVKYGDLKEKIVYKIDRARITEVAQLTADRRIMIYENFNQYLWCTCYSLLVLFDEGVHKPRLENRYIGVLEKNYLTTQAWKVFEAALSLTRGHNPEIFYSLPNPETKADINEYVGKANGLYSAAMSFILMHEFGHHFFGHIDSSPSPDQSVSDEFTADDFAIDKLSDSFNGPSGPTYKAGILLAILSLMFLHKRLNGGNTHPDLDIRLKNVLEKLNFDELSNLWGIASLGLTLWSNHFDHDLVIPAEGDTYKELFYKTYHQLYHYR